MDVLDLKHQIATDLADPAMVKVQSAQLLIHINKAARDLRNQGWYLPLEEDESIAQVADTYVYNVPANFVTISELRYEETYSGGSVYDLPVPRHMWEVGLDGGVPVIRFDSAIWAPDASFHIKVIGQKRPSTYTDDSDTIDSGCESFLGERALAYAARSLSPGSSEQSRSYASISEIAMRNSMVFLSAHPQTFRMDVNATIVPTR